MNTKKIYILRYDDETDHEQIGVFESKTLMFRALHIVIRDFLDIDIDNPDEISDVLDFYTYETNEIDVSKNRVYSVYKYGSNSYDFISTFMTKPQPSDGHCVIESKINEIDFKFISVW
ncbi:hypothetical protein [Staphylococcus succinus]|uniref:hypothetical protein n=1 Tax=Staphylococcus succinus TaxID=61015 RepID=UPI000E6898B3|nr:hypothetical protein [Staphylococcus succinus]RIN23970.1 hypothetical protein BU067_10835 [Staphylococcus succinus]